MKLRRALRCGFVWIIGLSLLLPAFTVSAAPPPTVTSISPSGGSAAGGTTLTISGTGFALGATVTVGGYAASAVSLIGDFVIFARTPAHAAGSVPVVVTNPDTQSATSPTNFTYTASPPITPVVTDFPVPTALGTPYGIAAGADGNLWFTEKGITKIGRITLSGSVTEFTIPTAGSTPHGITAGPDGNLWFTEYNGNRIGRITPGGMVTEYPVPTASSAPAFIAAGADGNLWFTERDGNRVGRVAIAPPPTVTASAPTGGTAAGGTMLTITGTNFLPDATVTVGGYAAVAVAVTGPTRITARTSPHATATGPMVVTNPDGQSATSPTSFAYSATPPTTPIITEFSTGITAVSRPTGIAAGPDGNIWFTEFNGNNIGRATIAPPIVTAAAPAVGGTTGGTTVTLTGANFLAGATVTFGGIQGTNVTVVSDTQITVTAPAHPVAATVDLVVTNPGGGTGTLAHGYTYGAPTPLPPTQPPGGTGGSPVPLPPTRPPGSPVSGTPVPLPPPRP
ncbi:MAG: virginiamycin B lyase family protein [Thermomicrobiales bacterium]